MTRPHDSRGASTVPPSEEPPRIVLFGIQCHFTEVVLRQLLARGADIAGLILPGPTTLSAPLHRPAARSSVPIAAESAQQSVFDLVPVIHVGSLRSRGSHDIIASLRPDATIVACYPRRIPMSIANLATIAAFNIHPSFLPENRGPDPLFWSFKRGDGRFGVTVHLLSPVLDAGAIVRQREFNGWQGVTEPDVERTLARHGADMALLAIRDTLTGNESTEQKVRTASYESWPTPDDFRANPSMPARRGFNFIAGVVGRDTPISMSIGGETVEITEALAYADEAHLEFERDDVRSLQCDPGTLVVRVYK